MSGCLIHFWGYHVVVQMGRFVCRSSNIEGEEMNTIKKKKDFKTDSVAKNILYA